MSHTSSSMIFLMANWNPNVTPDRSSLLSFRLRNTAPLIRASILIYQWRTWYICCLVVTYPSVYQYPVDNFLPLIWDGWLTIRLECHNSYPLRIVSVVEMHPALADEAMGIVVPVQALKNNSVCVCICSNQSFYSHFAGYRKGVGHHKMMNRGHVPTDQLHDINNWDACTWLCILCTPINVMQLL